MALEFTPKQKQEFLHHAVLAGHWYCNNQNTNEHPWGGIADSADLGRFVYEYVLHRRAARGISSSARAACSWQRPRSCPPRAARSGISSRRPGASATGPGAPP